MILGYGVDLTVHELARRLAGQYGHSVDVWTPTSDGTYANEAYHLREIIVYGAPVNRALALLELNAAIALRKLRRRLAAEGLAYDVVVPCTHPYYGAGRQLGSPDIFFNFGNVPLPGASLRARLNWAWLDIAEAWHKPRANCVASISRFLHEQQPRAVQKRGRVLHLGGDHYGAADPADTAERERRRREARTVLGLPLDGVLLGYCGRLHRRHAAYKGTSTVLALAPQLAALAVPAQVVLCGIGSPDDEQWVRECGALALRNLPPKQMPLFYDALDVYVTASVWEGFNLPLVEAAWHGVPSVAYAAGAHAEHVTSVLITSGDSAALHRASLELATDAARRHKLARETFQLAQHFSWDRAAAEFEQLCREVGR